MLSRRSGLRRVSLKRQAQQPEYERAVNTVMARARGVCAAQSVWPEVACGGRVDPHHILPRGRGGALSDPDNLTVLCRVHHNAVHAWPVKAKERGLLL